MLMKRSMFTNIGNKKTVEKFVNLKEFVIVNLIFYFCWKLPLTHCRSHCDVFIFLGRRKTTHILID